ncbi:hypothetical protein pb186bvf_013557 [Paramecium bursaria]
MIAPEIQNDYLEYASILDDQYVIVDTIGQGRYAKVKLAVNIVDKQQYAIKVMKSDPTNSSQKIQSFINEVQTQADLEHKNIIKVIQCKIDGVYRKIDGRQNQVSYFVMELADQGDLYELIEQTPIFSEKFARNIFQQLIKGIEHLHQRGLVHRDIKSENILFCNGTLKIADFGFCAKTIDGHGGRIQFEAAQYVGSPEYNPPELTNQAKKYYNPESADLFAAGVILFTMVMKSAPFKSTKNGDQYYQLLKQDKLSFWQVFTELNSPSQQFKDLLEKILEENPQKRITIEQIKKHPWMNGPILNAQDYTKELKQRYDTVVNRVKAKISNKREMKFKGRKTLKNNKQAGPQERPPQVKPHLQQSIEIIDTVFFFQIFNSKDKCQTSSEKGIHLR